MCLLISAIIVAWFFFYVCVCERTRTTYTDPLYEYGSRYRDETEKKKKEQHFVYNL